jgi:hypothetical protein
MTVQPPHMQGTSIKLLPYGFSFVDPTEELTSIYLALDIDQHTPPDEAIRYQSVRGSPYEPY